MEPASPDLLVGVRAASRRGPSSPIAPAEVHPCREGASAKLWVASPFRGWRRAQLNGQPPAAGVVCVFGASPHFGGSRWTFSRRVGMRHRVEGVWGNVSDCDGVCAERGGGRHQDCTAAAVEIVGAVRAVTERFEGCGTSVSEVAPAQWAADPYGRHELRYWDGTAWSEHVRDGNVPSRDPVNSGRVASRGRDTRTEIVGSGGAPADGEWQDKDAEAWGSPRRGGSGATSVGGPPGHRAIHAAPTSEPRPLMSGKNHALLGLVTCGLWLIAAPAIYWFRKRAFKPLAAWVVAWALLIGVSAATAGEPSGSTITVADEQPTSTGTVQGLVGAAPTTSAKPTAAPAKTATTPVKASVKASTTAKPKTTIATKPGTSTSTAPKPKPKTTAKTTTSRTDPRFDTCKAANAAGYGNYREGVDPEYDWYQDRDHDGIVCEF